MKSILHGISRRLPLLAASLLLASACQSTKPPKGGDSPDAGDPPDAGDAPDASDCPPLGDGTSHAGMISADETWRAADGPHRIDGALSIVAGATVTIEPCSAVLLAPGASVEVGLPDGAETGRLLARGDAQHPISFAPAGAEPWAALVVHAPSSIELAHALVEGGGVDEAALIAVGAGTTPAAPALFVDTVEVRDARGHGVLLDRAARFAPGSRALRVSGSGSGDRLEPLVVGLHALEGLPAGSYTGNARDEILVLEDEANALPGLQQDTTLRDLGVPYRVGRFPGDDLRVGANGGEPAALTIEGGVRLRFQPEGSLRLVSDADAPRGTLLVKGSAAAPVVFTSTQGHTGGWAGLYFESPSAEHDVAFARIEQAGGDCACSLTSCSPISTFNGAVVLDGFPGRAFIHDSTIADSAGHGFVRSWLDHSDVDFLENNIVESAAECAQTSPELSGELCPDPSFACGD